MLITTADKWFSICVRERACWTCECCGKKYGDGARGLHCSHYIGRGYWAVRHDPDNADAHCFHCHTNFEMNPEAFRNWKLQRLGQERYDILMEKCSNLSIAKEARRDKKQMARHYRDEYQRMMDLRAQGVVGRIEFEGYL